MKGLPWLICSVNSTFIRKRLESGKENFVSTDTVIDLAEVVLKNNIFIFGKNTLKQKQGDIHWYQICTYE